MALYRGSLLTVVASIALTHWTGIARIVRAEVLSLQDRPFIDAAISGGATRPRVLRRHLLPAIVPQANAVGRAHPAARGVARDRLELPRIGPAPHLASIRNLLTEGREGV